MPLADKNNMLKFITSLFKQHPLPSITTDHHTHLLPGVDDGVATFEESLHILLEMHKRGVQTIHLTPHCYHPMYPNTLATLQPVFKAYIKQLATQPNITVVTQTATTATLIINSDLLAGPSDLVKGPSDPTGPSDELPPLLPGELRQLGLAPWRDRGEATG